MADRLVWTLVLCVLDVVFVAAAPASPQSAASTPTVPAISTARSASSQISPETPPLPESSVEASSWLPSRDYIPSVAPAPVAPPGRMPVVFSTPLLPAPRPPLLVPMYASFATLQALDYHSTTRALASGAGREANPLMRPIVDNHAAFIAAKAAATTAIVVATERMWKKHPRKAVVFMVAANSAMAVVVAHNYSVK